MNKDHSISGVVALRTCPAPWKGVLLLACRKCQKKLKRTDPAPEAAHLKKALKRRREQGGPRLRILQVPCLKLCPKDAVTVCTKHQLARRECSIIRTPLDLDALYAQCQGEATPQPPPGA